MSDRRAVVVLDNARSAAQVEPLLPGAGPAVVVITSRDVLGELRVRHASALVRLEPLDAAAGVGILAAGVGERAARRPAAARLAALCGGLPLALRIVTERLVSQPSLSIAALVDELDDERARLTALSELGPEANVRTVFSWSYQRIDGIQAAVFRAAGLAPGRGFDAATIAAVTGRPVGAGKTMVVDDLVQYFGHSYGGVHRLDLHGVVDNYPLEIARVLNVGRDEAEAELERRAGQARQLWVVDNGPPDLPPDVVGALSMSVPGVATILVTEGGPTPEHGEEVRLDGLTDDEAVELVTRLYRKPAGDEGKDLTAALATGVSRHPMALAELARGARERHGVRTFAEHVGRVLDGSADGLDPIVGLFAERLRRETDPDVLTLLRLAAECAPDALPVRFTCLLAARFGLRAQTVLDALRRLRDTHLVAWGEGAWSVHAVIRLAARRLAGGR